MSECCMSVVELIYLDTMQVSSVSYMQDAYMHAAVDTTRVTAWNFTECASATCGAIWTSACR